MSGCEGTVGYSWNRETYFILGLAELEEGHGSVGNDDSVGLLEHLLSEEFLDLVEYEIETEGVLLDSTESIDRGLADFSGLNRGRGEVLSCNYSQPIAVLDEDLHDSCVYSTEHCLSDDGEVHAVCLPAHFFFVFEVSISSGTRVFSMRPRRVTCSLESMLHFERKAVSLLIGFALFKARLNLRSRDSVKMEEKEEGQVYSCSALNEMILGLLFGNLVHHVIKS